MQAGRGVHNNWSARGAVLLVPGLQQTPPLPVVNLPAGEEIR